MEPIKSEDGKTEEARVCDVAVLGGGPAGVTAATLLARAGLRVALVERDTFPRFRIGESLLPHSMAVFERMGIADKLKAAGFLDKFGAQIASSCGLREVTIYFKDGFRSKADRSLQVERATFDKLMLDHAAAFGVDVFAETEATGVEFSPEGAEIRYWNASGEGSLAASYVIDASGLNGVLVRQLGLRRPYDGFEKALASLNAEELDSRLSRLREEAAAGSPLAQARLASDPLGLLAPAIAPLAGEGALTLGDPLRTPDGGMRIVMVTPREESLGAWEAQKLMKQVKGFRDRALATWQEGTPPQLLITERPAFVAEISLAMHNDLRLTIALSAALVALVFWAAYRRLSLLAAIGGILVLSATCAITLGSLAFGSLNMITVGFFAILAGLGIDFGLLLYSC